jgi:4-hydroxybenzoate polyprenyltransferase
LTPGGACLDNPAAQLPRRLHLLRLVRFREWFHFIVLPLAGVDPAMAPAWIAAHLARGAAVAFCVLGFGYLLNAASDLEVDVDPRKNPLLAPEARRRAPAVMAALAFAALALAALGPRVGLAATAVSLVSGVVYSIGPRLKAVPLAGTLANATNFVPLLWVGAASEAPPLARLLWPAFAGLLLQSQILHEAADAEGDARAGVRTTFLVLGRRRSAVIAALFGAVPAMCGLPGGAASRAAIVAAYVVGFPVALTLASDPARAARLRAWHRWSGLAVGAALLLGWI